ncbi:MAG: hypothetical protein EKK42_13770 [Pseudonocardiaceae bacterium]|nr:MAG: hypothetical protein EKK42_13770 [Pseudonocardiaceae bacterium]
MAIADRGTWASLVSPMSRFRYRPAVIAVRGAWATPATLERHMWAIMVGVRPAHARRAVVVPRAGNLSDSRANPVVIAVRGAGATEVSLEHQNR